MEILIIMLVTVGIISFITLIIYLLSKIMRSYYRRRDKKRKQMFPELYELSDKVNKKTREILNYQSQTINPLKTQIDSLLKKYQYLPKEKKAEVDEKIEDLRFKHYTASICIKEMREEKKNLRKELDNYLKENNIDWY